MIYLDNSASSFYKPKEVFDAVFNALKQPFNPSRGGHKYSLNAGMLLYNTRKAFSGAFNCADDRVIFTSGCTEALNLALFGLKLENAHVITTYFEHNSMLRPLYSLQKSGKISLSIVSSPFEAAQIAGKKTRLIAVNHVSNVTGFEADLAAYADIASKNNALLLVDAAQSGGYIPLDMKKMGIDMMAVAGHKGLHGIQGAGALLLGEKQVDLSPIKLGGTGTFSSSVSQPNNIPEGFEAGTMPTPAIAAMGAGLNWSIAHQKENSAALLSLCSDCIEKLSALGGVKLYSRPNMYGIVAFSLDNIGISEAGDIFDAQFDIAVRCGFHCAPLAHEYLNSQNGLIRASFGCDSKPSDVDSLIEATKEIAAKDWAI